MSKPFSDLEIPKNSDPINQLDVDKFVIPFYLSLLSLHQYKSEINERLFTIKKEINPEITGRLLGDKNWRTSSVGAFFAALLNLSVFEEIIGKLLLKSDTPYAGKVYCLCLCFFNTHNAVFYLQQYLDYYLSHSDLWYDQNQAYAALLYLDNKNETSHAEKYSTDWEIFISNKPNWDLDRTSSKLKLNLTALNELKISV